MSSRADTAGEQVIEGRFLSIEELRRFSRPTPWLWLAAVLNEWVIIGLTFYICNRWPHWWVWVPAIFIIGTRQHALGIMAHEGTHYNVARTKFWNDLLANLFSAYALWYPVEGYRTNHLLHHRVLDTPEDPERASVDLFPQDWTFPLRRRHFFTLLLRDVIGIYQIQTVKLAKYIWVIPGGALRHFLRVALFQAVAITIAVLTGYVWTYVLLWIVPLFTIALLCFRLRTAAEHSGLRRPEKRYVRQNVDTIATTRTTIGCPIMRFLLAPYHMSFHIEHHLYPSVPVFRLRKLHEHLMKKPDYAMRARVTKSYRGLIFNELTY
jgi:fatty acid desaturase